MKKRQPTDAYCIICRPPTDSRRDRRVDYKPEESPLPFELSFSEAFFLPENIYDDPTDPPKNVWDALLAMSEEDWAEMIHDVFPGADPDMIGAYDVLKKVHETNTCTDLRTPVSVWIDEAGHHQVKVY